jgi:hypothetical protein
MNERECEREKRMGRERERKSHRTCVCVKKVGTHSDGSRGK